MVGEAGHYNSVNDTFSGAFFIKDQTAKYPGLGQTDRGNWLIGFDASRCSNVYSNVNEARPVNIAVRYIIKY